MPAPRPQLSTAATALAAVAAVALLLTVGVDLLSGDTGSTSPGSGASASGGPSRSGTGQQGGTGRATGPGTGAGTGTGGGALRTEGAGPAFRREGPLLLGASAPTRAAIERTEQDLGRRLGGVRLFRRWGTPLFDQDDVWAADGGRTLFLSIKARDETGRLIPFARIAQARPGWTLYDDMVEQARQLKEFGRPLYLTFNHEPDADVPNGTAAEFVAAWRNWVSVLRAEGVQNVRFVWTTTAFGYTRADDRAVPLFWPGEEWTDLIGVDAYNSYRCNSAQGAWVPPDTLLQPVMAFAAQHPRLPLVLMEWSSVEDPSAPGRKGTWFRQLAALLQRPEYRQVAGLLQWGGDVEFAQNRPGCDFNYASSPLSAQAFRDVGALPALQATTLPDVSTP